MGRAAVAVNPAAKAVRFINNLSHTKGEWAGQSFNLRPWQREVVERLFGTIRDDGLRQYRTCYVEVPRKNGKTTLAAAIALYLLLADDEPGAEVYSAAVDRDQASLVFNAAAQMVRNDPELSARLQIIDSRRRIFDPVTGSVYVAIPAEAGGRHGYNASAVIYDEIHAAPNRELYDVLTTSTGARRQPLIFVITTAGYDRTSICWELHTYAERVRDGLVDDPSFLPVLYAAPIDADWTDEAVWHECNPALGDFRSLDEMRIAAQRAREIPGQQNAFRRLYLCQWTEQDARWIDMATWDACAGQPRHEEGARAFAGLDLASTTDITAFVLAFPDGEGGYDVEPHFWVPEDTIRQRSLSSGVPYDVWAREGLIHTTPGNVTDYDAIRAFIGDLARRYRIEEIAYDRWNASQLITQLTEDGAACVDMGQGFASMSAPSKELEKLILGGKLRTGGHPVLRWMMSNVAVVQDAAGNIKPAKDKSAEKIDGIVALIMAIGRAVVSIDGAPSIYETEGIEAW